MLPTRPDIFLSRVLHLGSTGILLAGVVAPLIFDSVGKIAHPAIMPVFAILAFVTGLYNSFMLNPKPSKMARGDEVKWKILVHTKILLILAATPLLNFLPTHLAQGIRVFVTVSGILVGSYAKFFREKASSQ